LRTKDFAGGGLLAIGCVFGAATPAIAQEEPDLSDLSIEELSQINVRSASKRDEPLSGVARSLYVITGDEIASSSATSLPEALRLAPNLQVQQVDSAQYAITARGFNSVETSNKLLVLIDGRTIYTPLSSGVLWELHSPLLEDLAQIEVISGPGGTLYGPNAVNGVVNIMSRSALETIGGLARFGAGGHERNAAARYGFALGDTAAIRFYANWQERDELLAGAGAERDDSYDGWQAGFRADYSTERDQVTFQGDLFDQQSHQLQGEGASGGNLLARWSRVLSERSSFQLQAYYDQFERDFLLVHDALETFDAEAQLNHSSGAHDLVVGAGMRTLRDHFRNDLNFFQLDPPSERLWVFNVFARDRITVAPELSIIAGLKAERSSFTGFEILPNARIAWQPDDETLLWASVSRAVRTPSRIDRNLTGLPILAPSIDFRSEKLVAFETGYRGRPFAGTNLSVSAFFNLYDDIRTTETTNGGLPLQLRNGASGHTYGIEAWSTSQLLPWWRLSLGLSTIWKDFEVAPGRVDLAQLDAIGHDPTWQLLARSHMDITPRLALNVGVRAVDEISTGAEIDSYVEADAKVSYRVTDNLELFVAGRNLLDERHAESNDPDRGQLPERSLFAGSRIRF